jgi:hypothetical protein
MNTVVIISVVVVLLLLVGGGYYVMSSPSPTAAPTTKAPTTAPTTKAPTLAPTLAPTKAPTSSPTTAAPTTRAPTLAPTFSPDQISFLSEGCESDPVTLVCAYPNQTISKANLQYGRWNNNVCPHGTVNADTPPISKVYQLNSLLGRNNVTLEGKNTLPDVNEDIYPNVYKHWKLEYSCQ